MLGESPPSEHRSAGFEEYPQDHQEEVGERDSFYRKTPEQLWVQYKLVQRLLDEEDRLDYRYEHPRVIPPLNFENIPEEQLESAYENTKSQIVGDNQEELGNSYPDFETAYKRYTEGLRNLRKKQRDFINEYKERIMRESDERMNLSSYLETIQVDPELNAGVVRRIRNRNEFKAEDYKERDFIEARTSREGLIKFLDSAFKQDPAIFYEVLGELKYILPERDITSRIISSITNYPEGYLLNRSRTESYFPKEYRRHILHTALINCLVSTDSEKTNPGIVLSTVSSEQRKIIAEREGYQINPLLSEDEILLYSKAALKQVKSSNDLYDSIHAISDLEKEHILTSEEITDCICHVLEGSEGSLDVLKWTKEIYIDEESGEFKDEEKQEQVKRFYPGIKHQF